MTRHLDWIRGMVFGSEDGAGGSGGSGNLEETVGKMTCLVVKAMADVFRGLCKLLGDSEKNCSGLEKTIKDFDSRCA